MDGNEINFLYTLKYRIKEQSGNFTVDNGAAWNKQAGWYF